MQIWKVKLFKKQQTQEIDGIVKVTRPATSSGDTPPQGPNPTQQNQVLMLFQKAKRVGVALTLVIENATGLGPPLTLPTRILGRWGW